MWRREKDDGGYCIDNFLVFGIIFSLHIGLVYISIRWQASSRAHQSTDFFDNQTTHRMDEKDDWDLFWYEPNFGKQVSIPTLPISRSSLFVFGIFQVVKKIFGKI